MKTCKRGHPMTNWLPVVGFPNYAVSDHGDVLSWPRQYSAGGTLRWAPARGYRSVLLISSGERHRVYIHRLVAHAFLGPSAQGMVVNHKNGDKQDNSVGNLEWCTVRENEDHACANGLKASGKRHGLVKHPERRARGAANGSSKLTEADVHDIRQMSRSGLSQRAIAARFHVCKTSIANVLRGENWSYVPARVE